MSEVEDMGRDHHPDAPIAQSQRANAVEAQCPHVDEAIVIWAYLDLVAANPLDPVDEELEATGKLQSLAGGNVQ